MKNNSSCEEILELINSLIDGELEGDRLDYAKNLIERNPQCKAMFHTVNKTISLYRMRREEVEKAIHPKIDWNSLEKHVKNQ